MDRDKLRNAAFLAGAVFVFGCVTTIYEYYRDNNSMDFGAITHARDGAILHAVLWTIVAAVVFAVQLLRK